MSLSRRPRRPRRPAPQTWCGPQSVLPVLAIARPQTSQTSPLPPLEDRGSPPLVLYHRLYLGRPPLLGGEIPLALGSGGKVCKVCKAYGGTFFLGFSPADLENTKVCKVCKVCEVCEVCGSWGGGCGH